MIDRVTAHIDLQALEHNFSVAKKQAGARHIMAMVKANAYGHGAVQVAQTLTKADAFGVACLSEALQLREAGITQKIVVMSGVMHPGELPIFVDNTIDIVVHNLEQIAMLAELKQPHVVSVWLKVDTGMHRLGILPEDFHTAYTALAQLECVKQPITVMTHLADADNVDTQFTQQQLQAFKELTHNMSSSKSIGNSAALLSYQNSLEQWVRPGIMLYGASPFAHKSAEECDLLPVMTLSSRVIDVKHCRRGEKVGYGCTWQCPEDVRLAVVSIGYGDGYPRHAPISSKVLVKDKACDIVGRVSMDMITVKLDNDMQVTAGDEVVLWGRGLPVELLAAQAGTISYELLSQLTSRVKFCCQ